MQQAHIRIVSMLLLGLTCRHQQVQAATYAFTSVANSNGNYNFFGQAPTVNDSGMAEFTATPHGGGSIAIYEGNGGSVTQIVNESGQFSGFGVAAINNAGTVAFNAGLDAGGSGIYSRSSGGAITTIASTGGTFSSVALSQINSTGTIAFNASLTAGGSGVFSGNDGALTTIALSGGTFSDFSTRPGISDAGKVAFMADLTGGGTGVYVSDGTTTTTISTNSVQYDTPNIDSSGMVAFRGSSAIYAGSGGAVSTIADTSGPYSGFQALNAYPGNQFQTPGIDDSADVVFGASLDAGGTGLFTGADPTADRVIATGDPLFGSTLSSIGFFGGVSRHGDIAFRYSLANGVVGIAVATRVPEPCTTALVFAIVSLVRRPRAKLKQ